MKPINDESQRDVEIRVAALESAVERLNSIIQPTFGALKIAAPVALPFLKEAAQHEYGPRFFALLDLGEALLKYSAAIAFACAAEARSAQRDELMEMFKQPPTLGKLAEGLRRVLDGEIADVWPIDLIREAFRRPNGKSTPTARYLLDEFINVRNNERGHGAQQPEGYYQGLYLRNHLIVHDCLRACKHIELPLLHLHAVDHVKEHYGYKATLLVGGAPVPASDSIFTHVRVAVRSTCLWDYGARLLPMNPFVAYQYCPICNQEHVFFAERITADKISYHSYFGNHRITVDRTG